MNDKTKLMDEKNAPNNSGQRMDKPASDKTKVITEKATPQQAPATQGKHGKKAWKTAAEIAGLGAAGVAAGAIFMGMHIPGNEPGEDQPADTDAAPTLPNADLHVAESITDDMSFNEAFAAARADVGAGGYFHWHGNWYGTHYAEEWAQLTPEQQSDFANAIYHHPHHAPEPVAELTIHDTAPVASWVTDEMPLADAHTIARMEVGPGGVFVHQGEVYSTYTPDELAHMTKEQHDHFINSVNNADVHSDVIHDLDITAELVEVTVDGSGLDTPEESANGEAVVEGAVVEEGFIDLGDGNVVYGELVDTDHNGIPNVLQVTDGGGNVVAFNINEENGDIVDVREPDLDTSNEQVADNSHDMGNEMLADNGHDFDGTPDFDANADMSNWV